MQMAQTLVRSGFRTVAATPHMILGTAWMPTVDWIKSSVADLNRAIRNDGLKLEIVAGMEIALDPQIPDMLDAGRVLPLGNSSCLLIEPPFQQAPQGWEQVLFSILGHGHSILLAHPERSMLLANKPGLIERLIGSGVYLQVNWGSFLGQYGRAPIRTARWLANNGWIHCLATDSHRPGANESSPVQAATPALLKMIGQENLRRISVENPARLLQNQPPRPMTITARMIDQNKRPWWRFWY